MLYGSRIDVSFGSVVLLGANAAARDENIAVYVYPGGHSFEVWVELCRRGLQLSTLFKTKNYRGRYFLTLICFVLLCIQN